MRDQRVVVWRVLPFFRFPVVSNSTTTMPVGDRFPSATSILVLPTTTVPPYFVRVGSARFWYSENADGSFTLRMVPITHDAMSAPKLEVGFGLEAILITSSDDVLYRFTKEGSITSASQLKRVGSGPECHNPHVKWG